MPNSGNQLQYFLAYKTKSLFLKFSTISEYMTIETATVLKIPSFSYAGFDVPGLDISTHLIDNLALGDTLHRHPACELVPKSIPLAWEVGLYIVGRDLAFGIEDAEPLPEPVKEAGRLVYSYCQKREGIGVWHKDAVMFLPRSQKPKEMWSMPEGYAFVKYFKDINGLKENGDIEPSSDTVEKYIWLPPGGDYSRERLLDIRKKHTSSDNFIVPPKSGEGAYHEVTGTPRQTVTSKRKAIKMWIKAGLTKKQAENELSTFHRASSGVRAVWSRSCGHYYGPLSVGVGGVPSDSFVYNGGGPHDDYIYIGSFAASRAPRGK